MSIEQVKQQLHDLLVTKNFEPQTVNTPNGDIYSFDYTAPSGKNYGTVVVSTGDNNLDVYFGDNVGKSMENSEDKDSWFNFLQQLSQFAKRNRYSFSLQNLNRLKYTMQGQAAIKEGLFESWRGTKNTSWNAESTEARLMIKHKKVIGENDARFRYIESLFVETADGERFKLPFTKLAGGRAMVEHVRQGGKPYDVRGNHIATLVSEMNLLSRFKRANQGKIFEGETAQLVTEAGVYYETLQQNLKSLSSTSGYAKYFESWNPAEINDEDVIIEDLRHMFIEQNIDARIEQALPLLAKLKQQENSMKEANIFENWINLLAEGTWSLPETPEQQAKLVELLAQELPVGADAINATEQLYSLFGDDELFDRLHALADQDANADARTVVMNRLEELKDNPAVAQIIGQLKFSSPAADAEPTNVQEPEMEESMLDTAKKLGSKVLGRLGHGSDEEMLKDLQRKAGIPQTGKKPESSQAKEGAIGKTLGAVAGATLAPEIPGSSMIGGAIGDKIGDKVGSMFQAKEGAIGKTLGAVAGAALAPEIPGSSMIGGAIGDKIGDKVGSMFKEERTEVKDPKTGEVISWQEETPWTKATHKDGRGKVTNLSDKARRETEKMKKDDVKENAYHNDDEEKKIRHLMRKYGWSRQEALEYYHYEEHDPKDYEDIEESVDIPLAGKYGHSGKLEEFQGADVGELARIKTLAGILIK